MAQINLYKFFRGVDEIIKSDIAPSGLSKRYDEPTYTTFRVLFGQNSDALSGTNLLNTDYDRMPHPLFINQRVDSNQSQGNKGQNIIEFNRDVYSTRDFLRDSNEFTREQMLKEFIETWEDLQKNFQWYFQSIEGLGELLKIVPERGKRVAQDAKLTFTMLEGMDHRISYLLNLYKKIAWDDIYQRWVLPDLMKFFDIQIYITEFRTFHQSQATPNSGEPVYLSILNGILPTYLIECQMCEFDINSFEFSYKNKLYVNDNPEMASVSFSVKVGNVNEIATYPLFSHFIMNDYKLNGTDRATESGIMKDKNGRVTNEINAFGFPSPASYASTKSGDMRYRDLDQIAQDTFFQEDHISGKPFNEKRLIDNIKNSSPNYSIDMEKVDPMEPATWIGNAVTFGKSFAVNFVTQKIDKAKMTNVPGLGFSFNDAVAAIESKSFVSVLALIRKAIAESVGRTQGPSEQLNNKIDSTFKEFLTGLAQSEATDGDELELKGLATMVLSDRGKWEQVKDLSYATNMIGPNEKNNFVKIDGANEYRNQILLSTNNDRSKATDLDGETNLINPGSINTTSNNSTATSNGLQGKSYENEKDKSLATDLDGGPITIITNGIIDAAPSSATNSKISNVGKFNGTGGLGNKIDEKMNIPKPSESIGNKI